MLFSSFLLFSLIFHFNYLFLLAFSHSYMSLSPHHHGCHASRTSSSSDSTINIFDPRIFKVSFFCLLGFDLCFGCQFVRLGYHLPEENRLLLGD